MNAPVDPELMQAANERPNESSDSEVIAAALPAPAGADDFGAWLVSRSGRLPEDFEPEF